MSQAAFKGYISGLVQGVGFRFHTMQKAQQLYLNGYAENLADGRVCVYAEGEMNHLQNLVDWLEEGPPSAQVSTITVEWQDQIGIEGFDIR
ncbi:acylphosphatase [Neiella sp. HB171785]|uniref:acylphosphatase n=1 Tax=Neiella litorisoli TaxID=2771431 RepID=A0A8J6QKL8_9GAMM|nr:acylphosphatase [Neiella litorisoli]MBD1390999.1 acylphosphatase [Neiella litorisoli]